jgi:hypothetical protein
MRLLARQLSVFGLIVESDFDRTELHGFEVDMNGCVVTPELHPQRLCTGSLPAILKVSALFMAAKENAALGHSLGVVPHSVENSEASQIPS